MMRTRSLLPAVPEIVFFTRRIAASLKVQASSQRSLLYSRNTRGVNQISPIDACLRSSENPSDSGNWLESHSSLRNHISSEGKLFIKSKTKNRTPNVARMIISGSIKCR